MRQSRIDYMNYYTQKSNFVCKRCIYAPVYVTAQMIIQQSLPSKCSIKLSTKLFMVTETYCLE